MPLSQATLEERLRKMAETVNAVSTASRAVKDAAAQQEATTAPRSMPLVAPPLSPVGKGQR
jgi:hypothetical protein